MPAERRMRRGFVLAVLLLPGIWSGAQTTQESNRAGINTHPVKIPPLVQLPAGVDKVVLPLSRGGNQLFTKVRIDGHEAGWFLIDTGATCTFIDKSVAQNLGLRKLADVHGVAVANSYSGEVMTYRELAVGPVALHQGIAVAVDLFMVRTRLGLQLAGVLGVDFLREQPFTIDFHDATLTLYRRGRFTAPAGLTAYPLRIDQAGLEYVEGRIEGHNGWFAIDTGNAGAFTLQPDFLAQHFDGLQRRHAFKNSGSGDISGSYESLTATFDSIELLGRRFGDCNADCLTASVQHRIAGSIGMVELRDARLTMDLAGRRCWAMWHETETASEMLARLGDPRASDLMGYMALMEAASEARADVVSELLRQGAGVNVKSNSEHTALTEAVFAKSPEVVKVLLSAGADPDATLVWQNLSPLHLAAMADNLETVRALLAGHAQVDALDTEDRTPLFYAASADYPNIVRALLDAGAKVNVVSKHQHTPLIDAVQTGDVGLIKMLVERGAALNPMTSSGVTPLHAACDAGQEGSIRCLLDYGVPVNIQATDGKTPLMWAVIANNEKCVLELLEAGADPTLRGVDGKTALDLSNGSGPFVQRAIVAATSAWKTAGKNLANGRGGLNVSSSN